MQQYRKSGWFSALSKGVVFRTEYKLSSFAAITSYLAQNFEVAGDDLQPLVTICNRHLLARDL